MASSSVLGLGSLSSAPSMIINKHSKLSLASSRLPTTTTFHGAAAPVIECSSRPQKKSTAHHMKTRPKKTQPWDVRRKGPTNYPPLPPLPPDWSFADSAPSATTVDSGSPQPETATAPSV